MELTGKTIAITGAGGFIGLRMVERARARGLHVRGLDLSPEAARRAEQAGAHMIVGDVCDPDASRRLCQGAQIIFHTAAVVKEDGPWFLFRKVNVNGTRNMAAAAQAAGVERFVHLSSVMVYGFQYPPGVSEEGPLRGEGNPYCQTKIESEEVALAFHEKGRLEVIIIRPGDAYGPGSIPWVVRPIELMKQGLFTLIDGGRGTMNHIYVDNLLDAVFLSLERHATGEAFNVTDGQNTTFAEFFGYYARLLGKKRIPSMPSGLMYPLAWILEKGCQVVGREPPFTRGAIGFVTRRYPYSIEKARHKLGYEPRVRLEDGMVTVEEWLRARKMI